MKEPRLAVIVATKNRSEPLEKYALASLNRSALQEFICVVWDASDDSATKKIVEAGQGAWVYCKAPRSGLAAQRNDATAFVLQNYPSVRFVLFIDDDSELAPDALGGALETFKNEQVWGVNIPHASVAAPASPLKNGRRIVTSYLHNRSGGEAPFGVEVEWLSGCGMGFRVEVFSELGLCFPEAFQRFGGYALGEDVAFSFFLKKKLGKKLFNACHGTLYHHVFGGARLNVANMAASKWYNFHLLFEAVYDDVKGARLLWLKFKFKLFMFAAALKLLVRSRSLNFVSLVRGIAEARKALREFYKTQSIKNLMLRKTAENMPTEEENK